MSGEWSSNGGDRCCKDEHKGRQLCQHHHMRQVTNKPGSDERGTNYLGRNVVHCWVVVTMRLAKQVLYQEHNPQRLLGKYLGHSTSLTFLQVGNSEGNSSHSNVERDVGPSWDPGKKGRGIIPSPSFSMGV